MTIVTDPRWAWWREMVNRSPTKAASSEPVAVGDGVRSDANIRRVLVVHDDAVSLERLRRAMQQQEPGWR